LRSIPERSGGSPMIHLRLLVLIGTLGAVWGWMALIAPPNQPTRPSEVASNFWRWPLFAAVQVATATQTVAPPPTLPGTSTPSPISLSPTRPPASPTSPPETELAPSPTSVPINTTTRMPTTVPLPTSTGTIAPQKTSTATLSPTAARAPSPTVTPPWTPTSIATGTRVATMTRPVSDMSGPLLERLALSKPGLWGQPLFYALLGVVYFGLLALFFSWLIRGRWH